MSAGTVARAAPRHAWIVWGAGLTAYIVAVLDRTSFGVAGLAAADRFGVGASATGIVNVGGFVASLTTILLVGVVLDLRTGGAATYGLDDFWVALSVQYLVWAIGLAGVLVTRRQVRRRMAARGVVVPPVREVIVRRRRAGRRLL